MRYSRWQVLVAWPLTALFVLGAHPASGATRTKAGFPVSRGIHAGPATPGEQLWVSPYNGTGNSFDGATALGVSPDGSKVFVTGGSVGSTSSVDYVTVAYDASTGSVLWVERYNGPGNDSDGATALGVSPDGSKVFVTGSSLRSPGSSRDYATVAYDASTGTQRWVSRYNGGAATALGVSPDGARVFVTGGGYGGKRTHRDYATVAYDGSTGAQLWVSQYNGNRSRYDSAFALAVSPDGSGVFVTGSSKGTPGFPDYATVAYDASTGTQRWVERYNGPANRGDIAYALGVSADGSQVFVTGISNIGQERGTAQNYVTKAYSAASGAQLWRRRYNGPANGSDGATALGVSPDGSKVFVTGTSEGSTSGSDYATVTYAANGVGLWRRRYQGPGNDSDGANALGVSPDSSTVFVTGGSLGSGTGSDYATVAYDSATGKLLWVMRYNGPGNNSDDATALGVSPDGSKVFVTGSSGSDYATVAYSIT